MISKIKKRLATLVAVLALATPVMIPVAVHAQADSPITSGVCSGVNLSFSNNSGGCDTGDSSDKLNGLITQIINIFSIVVGVVAVIMIIVGGFKYITSGGDSSNVSAAKNTIIYAIIGLVVVALAQFIVKFVLEKSLTAGN